MFSQSIRRCVVLCVLAAACLNASSQAGPITPGNLVVLQVDNTTAVTLREFTTGGTAGQSISVPSTLPNALTMAYNGNVASSSEGSLTVSPDGSYLGFAGYRVGTAGSGTDRVIGRVDVLTGLVDTSTVIPNAEGYTGNSIRGAVWNGNRYWTTGTGTASDAGIRTGTFGSTSGSVQVSNTSPNNRVLNIFNNQLYTSSNADGFRGISTVGTGLPTTSGETTALLPGFGGDPSGDAYAYAFLNATTLYVADGRESGIGGIQKWTFDGTEWLFEYSTQVGTGAGAGARGLAIDSNGVIYATTGESSQNRIVSLTDNGLEFSTVTTLVTADPNTVFRGIVIGPTAVPEPGSILLCGFAGAGFAGAAIRRYRKRRAAR